ncbi:transposon Ty3-I Gag-Pol polyprotein [Caerostris extrusa]|uniref:Transposon Ty3-I Gag-Pol polyprotein n=1 Tax=Caerostris extrusa TaxID=172846 RepID=A0AAV4XPY6_CAEEX|nr:transposon Ty3-I Gag-Pol polyprotein [Caerostris extrusa]
MPDLNIIEIVPGKDPHINDKLLNSNICTQYFPLPNIEESVSAAKFITVIDLAKGNWQTLLSKQRYAAFVTSFGTYVPLRMPFGLVNAPYFFSKLMLRVLENSEDFAVPHLFQSIQIVGRII